MRNFSASWITGSTNHKTSSIVDHAKSEQHVASIAHMRTTHAKANNKLIETQNDTQVRNFAMFLSEKVWPVSRVQSWKTSVLTMQYTYGGQTVLEGLTKLPGSNIWREHHPRCRAKAPIVSQSWSLILLLMHGTSGFQSLKILISMLMQHSMQELNFMLRKVTKLQLHEIPHATLITLFILLIIYSSMHDLMVFLPFISIP